MNICGIRFSLLSLFHSNRYSLGHVMSFDDLDITQVHISMQYACHGTKYGVVLTRADNILMIYSEDLLMIFLIIF